MRESGSAKTASIDSLTAVPSLPGCSGSSSRSARPNSVSRPRARSHLRAVGLHQDAGDMASVGSSRGSCRRAARHQNVRTRARSPAPLSRSGVRDEPLDPVALGVVGLCERGVELVAAGGSRSLVLEVDLGWCLQVTLQTDGAEQRCRSPHLVCVSHRPRNLDPALERALLSDQRGHEQAPKRSSDSGSPVTASR